MNDDLYKYGFSLNKDDFLSMIDKSVQIDPKENLCEMNILFVEELNKIKLYHDDEWESYLMDAGIQRIITILRDYYLETYEKYIVKKLFGINNLDALSRSKYRAQLVELYRFYGHFDILPYAKDKKNTELIDHFSHTNDNFLQDFCMELYLEEKNKLTKTEINTMKRQIIGIIKKNTQFAIKSLNKSILQLANINEEFKEHILTLS